MNPDVAGGTKGTMLALGTSLFSKGTIQSARIDVWRYLSSTVHWADSIGLHDVLNTAIGIARRYAGRYQEFDYRKFCSEAYPKIVKAFNRANRRRWVRTKRRDIANLLKLGADRNVVFFLVSSHQNPQEAHKPLQGKVLVNAHWRKVLENSPDRARVASYVRNRKVMSVQKAMREPTYLFVRPNCRHHLIPLMTSEVLSSSPTALNRKYRAKSNHAHRTYTDKQLYDQKRRLYLDIVSSLGKKLGMKKYHRANTRKP